MCRFDFGSKRRRVARYLLFATTAVLTACERPPESGAEPIVISCSVSLSSSEVQAIETLNLRGCGDIDFRPLWEAENLRELTVNDPTLTEVRLLAPVRSLEEVRFEESDVYDITALGSLSELHTIVVLDTPLTDLAPLRRLQKLERLDLSDTYVNDLEPLRSSDQLKSLTAMRARIWDLSPLSELSNLESLNLGGNGVRDPRPLLINPNIEAMSIDLSGNCIDLGDPEMLAALEALGTRSGSLIVGEQQMSCPAIGYYTD